MKQDNRYVVEDREYNEKLDREREINDCEYCKKHEEERGFFPSHFPSKNCESGSRLHCTCDVCF